MLSLFIIIGFGVIISMQSALNKLANINLRWSEYRCSPIMLPFARLFGKDPDKNFSNCIYNSQSSMMGGFLKPINYLNALMGDISSGLGESVQSIRVFINKKGFLINLVFSV